MRTEATDWTLPPENFDAVMLTSGAAVRHLGAAAAPLKHLPALCVGTACADAARAAGFVRAEMAGGNAAAVLERAQDFGRVLHLAGVERTKVAVPPRLKLSICEVYRAVLLPLDDVGSIDGVMLYSQRSARHFAAEWARLGHGRDLLLVAISPAVAAAAGDGWQRLRVAAASDEASMLAALADEGL
jgi:uroporphyrinogen-III synthase